jgi:hypothetical protein
MADVTVKVAADSTQVTSGLNKASQSVDKFSQRTEALNGSFVKVKGSMNAFGDAATANFNKAQAAAGKFFAAFAAFTGLKSLFDDAGRINDISARFGAPAEAVQRIGGAAKQSGADLETVVKALSKAGIAAVEAAKGNEEYDEAFKALGVSAEEFAGLPLEEKLTAIADGYEANTNKAEANAAAVKLMGKSAQELIPLLAQGGDAIREIMDGIATASTDTISRMDEVGDRIGQAFANIKSFGVSAIGGIIDVIDIMAVELAAVINAVGALKDGLGAAKEAFTATIAAGKKDIEDKKAAREERNNRTSAANIEALREEARQEEEVKQNEKKKVKEDKEEERSATVGGETLMKAYRSDDLEFKKALVNEAKKEKEKENQQKINRAEAVLESRQNKLDSLESQKVGAKDFGFLRRIGGNLTEGQKKSASRDTLVQKQIDLQKQLVDKAQKTLDVLKTAFKETANFDGVN